MGTHKEDFWEGLVAAVRRVGSGESDEIDMAVLAPMTTDLALPWVRDVVKDPAGTWPRLLDQVGGMMPDGLRADLEAMPLHVVHRAARALLERFVQDLRQGILQDLEQIEEAEDALASELAQEGPAGTPSTADLCSHLEREILRRSDAHKIAHQVSQSASEQQQKAFTRFMAASEQRMAVLEMEMAESRRPVSE